MKRKVCVLGVALLCSTLVFASATPPVADTADGAVKAQVVTGARGATVGQPAAADQPATGAKYFVPVKVADEKVPATINQVPNTRAACVGDKDINGAGTTSWTYSVNTYWHDRRVTSIYLASEFGCDGGPISGIRYYVSATPTLPMLGLTIRMRHTTATAYVSPYCFENDGWTVCYQADTTIGATGWYEFVFPVPFVYDGVSNLEVDFSFNNASYSGAGTIYAFPSGTTRTKYAYCDSCNGDPLLWTCGSPNPTVYSSANVPRTQFVFPPLSGAGACCLPNYSCASMLEADCLLAGGVFMGIGVPCTPNPCPLPPGDTCSNPFVAAGFGTYTGDTCSFINDYDEVCPYSGGTAPDVVYAFTPDRDMEINIDLCLSGYDTKVYVYQDSCVHGTAIACNDDDSTHCTNFRSWLGCVPLFVGHTYYIVVDGYGASCGGYTLILEECVPCLVPCPPGGVLEGEPDCGPDYVDTYNGGCNSTPYVFQPIICGETICGKSGTYLYLGSSYRDTDWFELTTTEPLIFNWAVRAEFSAYIFILGGTCDAITTIASATGAECTDLLATSACMPPGTYWFWVGPSVFTGVPCGKNYVATLTCTPCTTNGACCYPDGTCAVVPQENCFDYFWGQGTLCDSTHFCTGACCYPDGACADLAPLGCTGNFKGVGTLCATTVCPVVPPNDLCENAVAVAVPSSTIASTVGATVDNQYYPCGTAITAPGVWYSVIGTGNTITATTCNLHTPYYDTKITVYCECSTAQWACIAGNDDNCTGGSSGLLSTVIWCSELGKEYRILVHGYSTATGSFQLDVFDDGLACSTAPPCEPCIVPCTPNEGEPLCGPDYVDTWNGGCNSTPNVFQPIICGQTICGESGTYTYLGSSYRDTDWFELVLTQGSTLTWTVNAEFQSLIFILGGNCASIQTLAQATGTTPCVPVSCSAECLAAGTYWLWVGPGVFTGVPCGSKYEAVLTCVPCTGACCLPTSPFCTVVTEGECLGLGGQYMGNYTVCDFLDDCNANGIPDSCDLVNCDGSPWCSDCNNNGILDVCDIASGTSEDCQNFGAGDGIPDECQLWAKNRVVVYDNGPLITTPGGGCGGDLSLLQTLLGNGTYGFGCQLSAGNRVADDFAVTGSCQIDTVTLFFYQSGSTPPTINNVNIQIWSGAPNAGGTVVWGDTTTNRLQSCTASNIYRCLDTDNPPGCTRHIQQCVCTIGTTLTAGTYWIDFQAGGSGASGPWQPPVTLLGQTGKPGGNAIQYTTAGWAALVDVVGQDLPFILNGSCGAPPNDCNTNGVPDECDIESGISTDYNHDGIPDECQMCGDIDLDGDVDADDYWALLDAFGTCQGNIKYNPNADFDGDNCITLVDFQAWRLCYLMANGKNFTPPPVHPKMQPTAKPKLVPLKSSVVEQRQ